MNPVQDERSEGVAASPNPPAPLSEPVAAPAQAGPSEEVSKEPTPLPPQSEAAVVSTFINHGPGE